MLLDEATAKLRHSASKEKELSSLLEDLSLRAKRRQLEMETFCQRLKYEMEKKLSAVNEELRSALEEKEKVKGEKSELAAKMWQKKREEEEAEERRRREEEEQGMSVAEARRRAEEAEEAVEALKAEMELLRVENAQLGTDIEEVRDAYREEHAEEFRQLQQDYDVVVKNCRLLQLKLKRVDAQRKRAEAESEERGEQLAALTGELEDAGDRLAAAEATGVELRASRRRVEELEEEAEEIKSLVDELEEKNQKVKEDFRHALMLAHETQLQKDEVDKELERMRAEIERRRRGNGTGE